MVFVFIRFKHFFQWFFDDVKFAIFGVVLFLFSSILQIKQNTFSLFNFNSQQAPFFPTETTLVEPDLLPPTICLIPVRIFVFLSLLNVWLFASRHHRVRWRTNKKSQREGCWKEYRFKIRVTSCVTLWQSHLELSYLPTNWMTGAGFSPTAPVGLVLCVCVCVLFLL